MKINCLIVDDEPLALDILEDYIGRTHELELVARLTSSADALNLLRARGGDGGQGIDLALLDIQMPGLDGLELAKSVGAGTRVIFTTAFPQYALDGFRVDALDYLLKPISFAEFSRAASRAIEWFGIKRGAGAGAPQTLIVKSDYKRFVIPLAAIVYIEGTGDYIRIHTADGTGVVQTLMNLGKVEEMLPVGRFTRVHRSYIVNLDHIKRIERGHIIFDGTGTDPSVPIPISDTYKETFLLALAARSL